MQRKNKVVMAVAGAIVASPAFADGFSKAETLLEKVKTGLSGLSLVTVTIACLWVGYKVLFGGSTIRECAPIIIGAIVIASAAEVASMMVG
ncbi:TrbC/VirB2 family protein [Salmonella enterica subsp. enterica serovar Enteritidis]|uniref:TriB protein n=1 Tax=Salmonella enteritidis TaxID=149539 RepID=A0A6X9FI45_SALEN|nr:TriB protein [Salmonella enterica subsp. enterica serovar Enteritidis]EEC4946845.1 TrbC/VirB2 family protein [Salmonella enterica]EDA4031887.1 TrbC/VirB2 family protein [Salmonella enterica subsp. enterica serovar Enteritidis]EDU3337400.1 TrbC/VirB2 family protein [Salmonella enterica subsp. enterica serovar Enteritidis]EGR6595241.1 TrbC/VirB2 family protein [Salmonella enterica]